MNLKSQDVDKLTKIQTLLAKNPLAFVGTVFFIMFWITYFIHINKSDDSEQYYKELYERERQNAIRIQLEHDKLKIQLLIKAGVIEHNKENDSIIKKQTLNVVTKILKDG